MEFHKMYSTSFYLILYFYSPGQGYGMESTYHLPISLPFSSLPKQQNENFTSIYHKIPKQWYSNFISCYPIQPIIPERLLDCVKSNAVECTFYNNHIRDRNQKMSAFNFVFPTNVKSNNSRIQSQTLGGRTSPSSSPPLVSTGSSTEYLILRIPSSTFSQWAGDSPTQVNCML